MQNPENLFIAILCGGESRRMGSDKSLFCYQGGLPQREFLWQLASSVVGPEYVVFSLNRQQSADSYYVGKQAVVDRQAGLGPMSGIVSVVQAMPDIQALLVLACDMPHVNVGCLEKLIASRSPQKFATVYQTSGVLQPLCAIYETERAVPAMLECLDTGQRGLQRLLRSHDIQILEGEPQDLANINYPEQ